MSKIKKIFSRDVYLKLLLKDIVHIKTEPNFLHPGFTVWIYNESKELLEELTQITINKK